MNTEYSKQHWLDEAYHEVEWKEYNCIWHEDTETWEDIEIVHNDMRVKDNLDPRSSNALYLEGREWRKYICKHYLANDLLDKLEDASDPTALMAFVDILTLLNYGMAQTAYNLLSATAVPSELDELKTWLLDALNTIAQD